MNLNPETIFSNMPDFRNHEEARAWLKEKFQDRILLKTTNEIEGTRVFYYHLVKDPETYEQYMDVINHPEKGEITNTEPFESYSTIEVSEDGGISFSI